MKSKASQQEGEVAVVWQGASLPALRPRGGVKLSPWVASSTVQPGTSPAAENTTVKPIIQRIKSES